MHYCPHFDRDFPDVAGSGCTVCIHGIPGLPEPEPTDWWLGTSSGAQVDPGDTLLQRLIAGVVCPRCQTSRRPIGCVCERNKLAVERLNAASDFLELQVEASGFTQKEAGHIMSSVFKRVSRRMTMTEDELADARLGVREQFGQEPRWFPPRTTEPTHLPV